MSHNPPHIQKIIDQRDQEKESRMTSIATMAKMFLAGSIFFLCLTLIWGITYVGGKLNQVQATTERALLIMDELPGSVERAEKLVRSAEESLKRSINEAKAAVPEVSKGLIDNFRSRLKAPEQAN